MSELSRRELQIAHAYASDMSYLEIADQLGRAPGTVRTHIKTIYRKLGISSKLALARHLDAQFSGSDGSSTAMSSASDVWKEFASAKNNARSFDPVRLNFAMKQFQNITNEWPGFSKAHSGISFCLRHQAFTAKDRRDAISLLDSALVASEQALRADFFDASAHVFHGRALMLNGDINDASRHFQLALELDEHSDWGRYVIMQAMMCTGNFIRSIEFGEQARKLTKDQTVLASLDLTLAGAQLRIGNVDEARSNAQRCVLRSNTYGHMIYLAALIFAESGNVNDIQKIAKPTVMKSMTLTHFQKRYLGLVNDYIFEIAAKHDATVSDLCLSRG